MIRRGGVLRHRRAAGSGSRHRSLLRGLALLAVIAATIAGGYAALATYRQDRHLAVGTIRLSVSPGHAGALDLYIPLVDWGVRFHAVRLPVRLRVDLRSVDRATAERVAGGGAFDVRIVREQATAAVAGYLRRLIALVVVSAALAGLVATATVRHARGTRARFHIAAAGATAIALGVALVILLPPRGSLAAPEYYAYGADIPRALEAVTAVQRSGEALDQELDAQLVGLARFVTAPGGRTPVAGQPTLTIASDLHNNLLALPILQRVAAGTPLLFVGDLTDRGSPVETALTRRIVASGRPFVFVSGNHDSDASVRGLANAGAVVLRQDGRLRPGKPPGPVVVRVGGLRVAGYADPFERREADGYQDRYTEPMPTADRAAFATWLRPLIGHVDVVMVHEPELITDALAELAANPPPGPLVFAVGHTHVAALERNGLVTVVDGGSIGGGGTGNLADGDTDVALARLAYARTDGFDPLAVDLVSVDPGTGAATARHDRLDEP